MQAECVDFQVHQFLMISGTSNSCQSSIGCRAVEIIPEFWRRRGPERADGHLLNNAEQAVGTVKGHAMALVGYPPY